MTIKEFLEGLLTSQDLSTDQEDALAEHKKEVTDFLCEEFGDAPVIKYAGSHAKGTMIRESYDLDIVCYFPSDDTRTLKEIRDDVSDHLSKKYVMEDKASAERITNLKDSSTPHNYHIDVVPGRFIEDSKDVFIHVAYGDKERMQTNLKTHIEHVADSGCVDTIRLIKLWNCRNNLHVKTFVLELFVVKALDGSSNKNNPKAAFIEVMEAMKDQFGELHLEDPANSNNDISQLISSSHRVMVVKAAEEAVGKISESDDVSDWKRVFRENNDEPMKFSAPPSTGPSVIRNPSGQWAQ
ncbi:MAG TPA: nucleotidyltransferase [Candidatus Paceibacterota bacterium]